MRELSDYEMDLRAEEAACYEDAISEAFEALGLDRQLDIIRDIANQDGGAEWLEQQRIDGDHESITSMLEWLTTEEAGLSERLEFITSGYGLSLSEAHDRFCVTEEERQLAHGYPEGYYEPQEDLGF